MIYESQTFRLECDDAVATLWFDFRGKASNAPTMCTLNELSLVLDRLARLPTPDVILFRSSRPGQFLGEFDIAELAGFKSPLEFAAFAKRGQEVTRKIAGLAAPTVAYIEGRCAGAGLEIALACTFRFAIDSPETRFELPEVARGLIPCWGGVDRARRLIGMKNALQLLLASTTFGAAKAHKVGLVDHLTSPTCASTELITFVDRLRDHPHRRSGNPVTRLWRSISSSSEIRRVRRQIASASGSAKIEMLRVLAAGLSSEGEGLSAERAAIARLATSTATRNRLALHTTANPTRHFAEPANPIPPLPMRIGIVGGGEFGTTLACRLARSGREIVVQEAGPVEVTAFNRRVANQLRALTKSGDLSAPAARATAASIRATNEWTGFENADFVVEAASEDPGIKRNLFHELERRVRPRVILATASTTVTIDSLQAEMSRPSRCVGLHLSDSTAIRPIAELTSGSLTDLGSVAALTSWAKSWGFIPIQVADRPGRLVRLVQYAYLSEGVRLVAEGLPIDRIDAGCREFGMASGPLEWCDDIGLDRLAEQIAHMQIARDDRFARNLLFQRLLPHECLGRATGVGFYRYGYAMRPNQLARMLLWQDLDDDGIAPYVFDPAQSLREGIERLILRTVNEAAAALADEPDSDPAVVDMALALGMGWAPERGGPLRFADELGLESVVDRLGHFAERHGQYLAPCDELVRRAEAGESFYGREIETPIGQPQIWRMVG